MLTKEDLINKKQALISQYSRLQMEILNLNQKQQQLFQVQGAILFIDQELERMKEETNNKPE